MKRSLAFLLIVVGVGCSRFPPRVGVYDGLLPPQFVVQESAAPLQPAVLRTKTVAIVASPNFENYVNFWTRKFLKGEADQVQQGLAGAGEVLGTTAETAEAGSILGRTASLVGANNRGVRQASDPRRLADAVGGVLRESFQKVIVATDFADARDKQADYIALVDFSLNAETGWWDSKMRSRGGVYLFDRDVKRVFAVEADSKRGQGMFEFTATNMFEGAVSGAINQIVAGMRTNLRGALR